MRIRAVDPSGATLTEVAKTPANAAALGSLDSPQVVVAPFSAPADVQDMEIWVRPSPTATDVTSWSATGE